MGVVGACDSKCGGGGVEWEGEWGPEGSVEWLLDDSMCGHQGRWCPSGGVDLRTDIEVQQSVDRSGHHGHSSGLSAHSLQQTLGLIHSLLFPHSHQELAPALPVQCHQCPRNHLHHELGPYSHQPHSHCPYWQRHSPSTPYLPHCQSRLHQPQTHLLLQHFTGILINLHQVLRPNHIIKNFSNSFLSF